MQPTEWDKNVAHLIEMWHWRALAGALEVSHVDELVVVSKARVGSEVFGSAAHIGEVPKLRISPAIELSKGWAGTPLRMWSDESAPMSQHM